MKRKRSSEPQDVTPDGTPSTDLDQLIQERKQEKRKALNEKLQRKLRIIRDRRASGRNNEPFPEGTFARLKRNDILRNILEYLTHPTDVSDAFFACGTFAEILEKRRIQTMLPKVLNVFKIKLEEVYEFKGRWVGNACYQNWSSICLSARGVCKTWKETVDFHSEKAHEEWLLTTDWTINKDDHRTNVFLFNDAESIDEATSSLISHGLTVSPIRDVHVFTGDRNSDPPFPKLMEYFKAHGASVRFLCINYESPENIAANVNEKLCNMLKCMRNLKRLSITFFDDDDDDVDADEVPELGEAFLDNQQGINLHPLPALESLVHFSCSDWGTNESLIAQILRKYVSLKSVKLYCYDPLHQNLMDALMALRLERFEGLHTIITANQVTWPLKYLRIFSGWGSEMNASVLFPAINRFRETLEDLQICGRMIMDAGGTTARLELPQLKTVSMCFIRRGMLGFDDLLPLKSLVKIIVHTPTSVEYEDENALVKVKTYFESGEMHKSNVWQCFPNLMHFQIRWGCTFYRPTPP